MEILGSGIDRASRVARWLFAVLLLLPGMVFAPVADEYEVKMAYIYNFTKFVEWPKPGGSSVFAICIVGDDPFGLSLDQLVKGKTANSISILVRRLKEPAEARQCQIAFVRQQEEAKAAKLIEAVRGLPVLTVGEGAKFANGGGMISFSMKDERVVFGIDLHAAESADLKISAKLMTVAKSFKGETP
jgi:hypothetical protein